MPELPEVETVRRGLAGRVVGRRVAAVEVRHPRAVRRHPGGADDFVASLVGHAVRDARRRGKYLWLPLDSGDALLAHLGMSGQFRLRPADAPDETHLRVRITFDDGGPQLRFVDQRTFGGLAYSVGGATLPREIAHIAPDPLEAEFDDDRFVAALRRRRGPVKNALLDQSLISGIGNIYADEALWRARLHWRRPADRLTRPAAHRLLAHVRDVLDEAIAAGGTSFDALYVDVDGDPGSFDRDLAVYGREGLPCPRCGTPVRREPFANRSAYSCPRCQPPPRRPAVSGSGPVPTARPAEAASAASR